MYLKVAIKKNPSTNKFLWSAEFHHDDGVLQEIQTEKSLEFTMKNPDIVKLRFENLFVRAQKEIFASPKWLAMMLYNKQE